MKILKNKYFQTVIQNSHIIIINLALLFFVLNTYGHVDLLTDTERQQNINQLEEIIQKDGCIPRTQAKEKLNLNKHEMIEVVRNASGYPRPGERISMYEASQQENSIPSMSIFTCYTGQKG